MEFTDLFWGLQLLHFRMFFSFLHWFSLYVICGASYTFGPWELQLLIALWCHYKLRDSLVDWGIAFGQIVQSLPFSDFIFKLLLKSLKSHFFSFQIEKNHSVVIQFFNYILPLCTFVFAFVYVAHIVQVKCEPSYRLRRRVYWLK